MMVGERLSRNPFVSCGPHPLRGGVRLLLGHLPEEGEGKRKLSRVPVPALPLMS